MSDCCFTQCFCTICFFLGHCESVLIKKSLVHVLFMQCWCSKSPGIASYVPSPGTRTLALKHCSDWYRSFVPSPGTRTLALKHCGDWYRSFVPSPGIGTLALRWLIRTDALLALQVSWCSAGTLMFKTQTEARQAKLLSWFHSHNCQPTKYPSDLWLQWNRMTWRHPSLSCSHVYWPLGLIPPQVNQPFLLVFLVLAGLFLVFLLLFLAWNHTHAQPITIKASHPQKCHCLKSHTHSHSLQSLHTHRNATAWNHTHTATPYKVFTPTEMPLPEITHTQPLLTKSSHPQKRHCLKSHTHSHSLQSLHTHRNATAWNHTRTATPYKVFTPTETPLPEITHAQPLLTKSSHPQKRHCLKSHTQSQSLQVFTPTEMSQPEITHTHTANHYKCSCPQKRHCLKSQMHSQSLQRSSHPQKCRCLKSHKNPILTEVLTPTEIPLLPEMKANFYGSPQTHRHVT